jgi:putative tonB protein
MYTCGDEYSLAFYNESLQKWEPLPTNPIIEDILWMLHPDYHPYRLQTIELYTSEIPNRPGNYRIYKTFNGGEVAYAEFELVDRKGVKRLRKLIDDYWDKNSANPCDTVAHNISTTWIVHDDGDTIFVGLMNNTPRYQEMFRRKVVSYSAVSHGKVVENVVFDKPSFSDTLQVTMQTEKAVYPVGTETITVQLTNENPKSLFFGEDYWIVRKEGQQWIYLHDNGSWTDIGYGLEKGHTRTFTARLRPLVNDNRPGTYRIIKEIGFFDSRQDWYMAAEFRIE